MAEHAWLLDLISVHGSDVHAMARDKRRNVWQKTPGEIRRAYVLINRVEILTNQQDPQGKTE